MILDQFHQCLAKLGADAGALLAHQGRCQPLKLEAGAVLLPQGANQSSAFFLGSGVLRACHYSSEGQEHIKEFYLPGELCLLYASWLDGRPTEYQLEALTRVEVLKLPLALLDLPQWQGVCRALMRQQLLYKEEKEAFFLLNTPQERYQALLSRWPQWVEQISQAQLARYIGISPISLSRIRRRINQG
ncbi:Crp/Fnr family transcriptional regulator [Ferrimonas sediminicola]|uniref:Crp/Fnr family transcriptional regulator n=1 Tax=Ferrimonas sediminicola TaxID=2569538 RepID=A0A4U1BGZ5_9GAMM|nr:Crp/Fnr family transcriptional regulator [Ferrimonas sediminicola]TKB50622.1 Crp/Fnr family transcriptional regulator [Ferrimonas sediminicola]